MGAALLVAGNVIIGRRDEGEEKGKGDEQVRAENGEGSYGSEDREGLLIGEGLDDLEDLEVERKRKEEEDMLQLEEEEEE